MMLSFLGGMSSSSSGSGSNSNSSLTIGNNSWLIPCLVSFTAGASSVALIWWYAEMDQFFPDGLDDDTISWIDPWKQSVEDLKSRIGELPRLTRRSHWPWETIRHRVFVSKESSLTQDEDNKYRRANSTISVSSSTDDDSDDERLNNDETTDPSEQKSGLCIGSIFGLDVGGTLAKLVYFEQKPTDYDPISPRQRHYHVAASAQAVLNARRGSRSTYYGEGFDGIRNSLHDDDNDDSSVKLKLRRTKSLGSVEQYSELLNSVEKSPLFHSEESNLDLKQFYELRQESVPDDLNQYGNSVRALNGTIENGDSYNINNKNQKTTRFTTPESSSDDNNNTNNNTTSNMKKSRSMFDLSQSRDRVEALDSFYSFAKRLDSYRAAVKDHKLSFFSRDLGGEFHFIRFETRQMRHAMDLIRANNLHRDICEMGATGGGAHKYEDDWERILGIEMDKQDELDSLVAGMQFVLSTVVGECYTFRPKTRNENGSKENGGITATQQQTSKQQQSSSYPDLSTPHSEDSSDFHKGAPRIDDSSESDNDAKTNDNPHDDSSDFQIGAPTIDDDDDELNKENNPDDDDDDTETGEHSNGDDWWWSRKVQRDAISYSSTYPYLLVTIGTGVSVLRVDGPRKHERISGSTIGGGTYWGLMRLLTDVETFEDVMKLAAKGDPAKVDMMVGDIYGKNSDALEKIGLPSNLVASSFGKLVAKEDPAKGLTQEDLARALLLMVTNNIGQVAYLNAKLHNTPRIYFVGNFLRQNDISQRRLSWAILYWSKGEMEALFLEHEGYFGALGAFLLSQNISHGDQGFSKWNAVQPSSSSSTNRGDKDETASDTHSSSFSGWHRRSKTFGA